jgi:hypothetical protein
MWLYSAKFVFLTAFLVVLCGLGLLAWMYES